MRLKRIFIIILLLSMAGCNVPSSPTTQSPEISDPVELAPTSTPEIAFTSTSTPIPTEPSTPTPTMTHTPEPAEPILSQSAAIIARVEGGPSSFLLVGGSKNGNW